MTKVLMKENVSIDVDYASGADAFASAAGRSDSSSEEEEEEDDEIEQEDELDEEGEGQSEDDGQSEIEYDQIDGDEDDGEEEEEPEGEEEVADEVEIKQPVSSTGEPCTFDLRNLLALNAAQTDTTRLYKHKSKPEDEDIIIENSSALVNEEYLIERATDGCTQLIAALWQLPVERSDAGPLATLPSYDESKIPRSLPPPDRKKETKWEKFAKERGIALNKNKRSQKVWDEATGSWMFRHGYNKAKDDTKEWPIMEVKGNQDPYADPWERLREEKLGRTEKNLENRMRNKERAGELAKGTTTRLIKSRTKSREAGKPGGLTDKHNVPSGVPVDLQAGKGNGDMKPKLRGKASLSDALLATQKSTASLGKFDKMREGEPERAKALAGLKKRKFESATDGKVIATESERNLKLLKSVVDGGGAAKEKLRKKGKLAKGETAYDYQFDDGLGASSFKKKKGRAGAGKARKMTKKRAK